MPMTDARPPITKERKLILIVDDMASDTRLVKPCLEQPNEYTVREENVARRTLAAANEFRPHLLLLDVRMPGPDGGEPARASRPGMDARGGPIP